MKRFEIRLRKLIKLCEQEARKIAVGAHGQQEKNKG
jgi:hypothetical protein